MPSAPTMEQPPLIYIVDDDSSVRHALSDLMASVGFDVVAFPSAIEFLERLHKVLEKRSARPNCVILDVRMPEIDGLEVQEMLLERKACFGIVFMTGYGDVEMTVKAMRAGASNFLEKPFRDDDILNAVHEALDQDKAYREGQASLIDLQQRYASLTRHERILLDKITDGLMNKQIASDMHLSEITIKVHRRELMRKMGAESHVELIRLSTRLKTLEFNERLTDIATGS